MTWDELLSYCLAKPGAWPDEPWAGDVVVKVGTRIFAFLATRRRPGSSAPPPARRPTSGWRGTRKMPR